AESSVTSYLNKGLGSVAPFYVVVEGLDENGNSFRRLIPRLISPSRVLVECDLSDLVFRAGVRTQANITVTNNGANDSFVFSVADTKGFSSNTRPKHRHIATGESRVFTVILQAPESTQDGLATILTATVHGYRRESFQYGVCTVVVGQKKRPHVNSLAIVGTINGRYAETVVTSIVTNNADIGREAEFHILLPSDAYIVNLTMATANETIVGSIETKEKAKKIYKEAKKTGKTAGHVAARDTSTRAFKTSLFVSPREVVTFQFTYQQLLRRV
uniref:VIT domain-containing protein n=1 Tax=Ciona savignyi TaxID=51511 RepID=H2ZPC8_CIOSA